MVSTHKVAEAEFLQANDPSVLIPKGFDGTFLVVPSDLDADRLQVIRKDIDATASSFDHVATFKSDMEGWIIQRKGPRD